MSLKYQRVKQADLALPAPLRWLTRAFSSITLAVTLLALVAIYGMVASVPVAFLARGGLYALATLLCLGGSVLAARVILRPPLGKPKILAAGGVVVGGAVLSIGTGLAIASWAAQQPWFYQNRAEVIYRLPYFEMTEMEFYGWWPLKLILALFVLNLIWATIRRIEFKFANLGVLTVHTGIITVALGSIFYSRAKVEGDALLFRHDLGGQLVHEFYDATTPAIYFTAGEHNLMIPLPKLPRYNDYKDGYPRPLHIQLDAVPAFSEVLGPQLHASISEFISYGELAPKWVDASTTDETALFDRPNPAIRLEAGDKNHPDGSFNHLLISGIPGQRVVEEPAWAIEYLDSPDPRRISDLMSDFEGEQGMVVDVPATGFHAVYAIAPGQTIVVGDTGYTIKIEAIGPYGMSFATRGYEGAQDTRAMVQVIKTTPGLAPGSGARQFRRIVMHRYPERSQDFVPAPGDPNVGPMGKRTAPDPAIRLAYIDASKLQFWIISGMQDRSTPTPDSHANRMRFMVRIPGHKAFLSLFPDGPFPIGTVDGQERWMHVTQRIANAVQVLEPTITPANERQPKDEGTFLHALLPVDLYLDAPAGENFGFRISDFGFEKQTSGTPGTSGAPGIPGATDAPQTSSSSKSEIRNPKSEILPWHRRVWLANMRYPEVPDDLHRPVQVEVPGIGLVTLAFSRRKLELPFAVGLDDFEMQPYPGTDIPRDFIAHLSILNPQEADASARVFTGEAHLNNPLLYNGIKLSQTGWDPGEPTDPARNAKDANGRFTHQQRFTILGVGNNRGIHVIFVGACLIILGIPWAFYIKPLLAQRQKRKIQEELARNPRPNLAANPSPAGAGGQPRLPVTSMTDYSTK